MLEYRIRHAGFNGFNYNVSEWEEGRQGRIDLLREMGKLCHARRRRGYDTDWFWGKDKFETTSDGLVDDYCGITYLAKREIDEEEEED